MHQAGAEVVALEPWGPLYRHLRENVGDVVDCVRGAVSGSAQWVGMGHGPDGLPRSVDPARVSDRVWAHTLDGWAAELGVPEVVKLDVEGTEVEALEGAGTLFGRGVGFVVECHSPELCKEVVAVARSFGRDPLVFSKRGPQAFVLA